MPTVSDPEPPIDPAHAPLKARPARVQFRMATVLMLVITAAAMMALFAKVRAHPPSVPALYWKIDVPVLFLGSIGLTAVALGSLKSHSANQTMLQVTLACLGYLSLIWVAETNLERPLLYWFQGCFAILVTVPLVARRVVKDRMGRGPRRTWWKRTCEAVLFSFLTLALVLVGFWIQFIAVAFGRSVLTSMAVEMNPSLL